jgi:hypothetical protein
MTAEIVQPARSRKWYEIWWDVWSHPGTTPFQTMLDETPNGASRGFIWIGVMAFVVTLISTIFSVLGLQNLIDQAPGNLFSQYSGFYSVTYICGVILSPIFAIIGIAISASIYHLFAKLFKSTGKWGDLVYCLSAVTAPSTLFGGIIALVSLLFYQIPILIFIPIMVAMVFSIYVFILNVNAIRAAENIGTGQAIGTILIPVVIVGVVVACCTFTALIPIINTAISGQ